MLCVAKYGTRARLSIAFVVLCAGVVMPGATSAREKVYITNGSFTGAIVSVDAATGTIVDAPLTLGALPRAVAVAPDGSIVYAVNTYRDVAGGPGSVSVISAADWRVVATVPVGVQATGAALSPNGDRLYVANTQSGTITIINTSNLSTETLQVGRTPLGVVVDPTGQIVYVAGSEGVKVVSVQQGAVIHTIALSDPPTSNAWHLVVSPNGRYLYVTERVGSVTAGNVVIVDTGTRTVVARIPLSGLPETIAISNSGDRVYVGLRGPTNTLAIVSAEDRRVLQYIALGVVTNGVAVTPDDRHIWVMLGDARVAVIDAQTHTVEKTLVGLTGAASFGEFIGPRPAPAGTSTIVEFYNATLGHYFITQHASEVHDLDSGVHPGWARTGQTFFASPTVGASSLQPVCRFYSTPAAGFSSHFYSASIAECAAVSARFSDVWLKEADNVFAIALPDGITGACPAGTEPVYRLWNNRADSNHRYTTNPQIRVDMIAEGFVSEGYGPLGVAMCGQAPN